MANNFYYPEGKEFVIGDLRFDIASGKMLQTVLSGWLTNHETATEVK